MNDHDERLRVSHLIEDDDDVANDHVQSNPPKRPDLDPQEHSEDSDPVIGPPGLGHDDSRIPQVIVQAGGEEEASQGLPFDPILLLIGVWRRRSLIVMVFAVVSGLGFLGALASRHHDWQVYASILRKSDQKEYLVTGAQPIVKLQTYTMPTVLKLVKATENIDRVIEKLGLEIDPQEISQAIVVNNPKDTQVIELIMTWPDVQEAVNIVNSLATAFIEYFDRLQKSEAYQAFDYLGAELDGVRRRIDDLESELVDIKQEHEIVNLSDQAGKLLQQLSEFDVLAYKERLDAEMAWTRFRQVELELEDQAPSIVGTTFVKKPVQGRLAQLETELAKVLSIYTEEAPQVKELQNEIERVRVLIRDGIEKDLQEQTISRNPVVASLQQELVDTRLDAVSREARATGFENAANEFRERLMGFPEIESRLANVGQRLETLRSIESILGARVEEVRIIRDSTSANLSLAQRAKAPRYPLPSKAKLVLAAGIVLGLGLGLATALGLELLDTTIKSSADMEKALSLECLAEIPIQPTVEVLLDREESTALVDVYRQLATTLLKKKDHSAVWMVAGADHFEGRTTIALNLARVVAWRGLSVCLVDCDFDKPDLDDLGPRFGVKISDRGLAGVLRGELDLHDALLPAPHPKEPFWLPVGSGATSPELLTQDRVRGLFSALRRRFDLVVLDSPPVLTSSIPQLVAPYSDEVIVVVETFALARQGYVEAVTRLQASGADIAGGVVNKVGRLYQQQYSPHRFLDRDKGGLS